MDELSHNESTLNKLEIKKSFDLNENFLFTLNHDIFLILYSFLDTISILKFQAVNHNIRRNLNDKKLWSDRWIWKNENLKNSLPKIFVNNILNEKSRQNFILFRNIDVVLMRLIIEISFGIKPLSALTNMLTFDSSYDDPEQTFDDHVLLEERYDNCNNNLDNSNNSNNNDFEFHHINDLNNDINSRSNWNNDNNENSIMFQNKKIGNNRYNHNKSNNKMNLNCFHCYYLLSILTDTANSTYTEEFRRKYLVHIVEDLVLNDLNLNLDLDINLNLNLSSNVQFARNFISNILSSPIMNTILIEKCFFNISKKAFLHVRSQVQYMKWFELFNDSEITKNDDMRRMLNKFNSKKEDVITKIINKEQSTPKNLQIKNAVVSNFRRLEEGFTIIADTKIIENKCFCDRTFLYKTINRLVYLIRLKLFENRIFEGEGNIPNLRKKINDFDENFLREKVIEMDRTIVLKAMIAIFSGEGEGQGQGGNNTNGTILKEGPKEFSFSGDKNNYYNSLNSFIDEVSKRQTGIPISLSVLFLSVADRLGLGGVRTVGLAGHVMLSVTRRFRSNGIRNNEIREKDIRKMESLKNGISVVKISPGQSKENENINLSDNMNIIEYETDSEEDDTLENNLNNNIQIKFNINSKKSIENRQFYDSSPFSEIQNLEIASINDVDKIYFCDIFNDGTFVRASHIYQQFSVDQNNIKTRDFEILKRSVRNFIGTLNMNYHRSAEEEMNFLCQSNLATINEYEYIELISYYKRKSILYDINHDNNNNNDNDSSLKNVNKNTYINDDNNIDIITYEVEAIIKVLTACLGSFMYLMNSAAEQGFVDIVRMVGVRLNRLFNSSFIEHSLHMKEYSSSQSCVNDSEMHKRYDNSDKNNNNNDNNDNSGKNSNNNSNNDNNKNDNHDNSGKNNNSNNKDNINDGTINVKHESVYKLFEKKLLTMKELNKSILIKQFEKDLNIALRKEDEFSKIVKN